MKGRYPSFRTFMERNHSPTDELLISALIKLCNLNPDLSPEDMFEHVVAGAIAQILAAKP